MLKDRLRSEPSSPSLHSPPKKSGPGQPQNRASNGLDQFFASLQDQQSLSILDFSGASQANISFITSMGHRIYSNDALRTLEEAFGTGGDFIANQSDPERAALFLRENLEFPDRSFDGALIWDTLQFLAPPLLQDTVDRLYRILRPQSSLLAFFHAEEKARNRAAVLLPHCGIENHVADARATRCGRFSISTIAAWKNSSRSSTR